MLALHRQTQRRQTRVSALHYPTEQAPLPHVRLSFQQIDRLADVVDAEVLR